MRSAIASLCALAVFAVMRWLVLRLVPSEADEGGGVGGAIVLGSTFATFLAVYTWNPYRRWRRKKFTGRSRGKRRG